MMKTIIKELLDPVSKSTGKDDAQLRKKCAFARMCLERLPAQSQKEYVRNSLNPDNQLNQDLEDHGYESFRTLVKAGKIKI